MTDTESRADAAATAPGVTYEPKAIFSEEWARIVPKWLDDSAPETKWDGLNGRADEIGGRVLGPIPLDTYRLLCRSAAHGWCALRFGSLEEEHRKQANAMKRIVTYDLKQGAGSATCAVFDMGNGLIRECAHEHKGDGGDLATIDGGEAASALIALLKKSGVFGGA